MLLAILTTMLENGERAIASHEAAFLLIVGIALVCLAFALRRWMRNNDKTSNFSDSID